MTTVRRKRSDKAHHLRLQSFRCKALGESSQPHTSLGKTVYPGIYSPWTVDSTDVREVILYRSGLVTAAASFVVAASAAFLPDSFFLTGIVKHNLDFVYAIGAGGLGLSLFLIHIHVTEIKRALQAFWGLGVVGFVAAYAVWLLDHELLLRQSHQRHSLFHLSLSSPTCESLDLLKRKPL
ncbi:uncharacterized protein Pyn_16043 [Prunus yedoensis var. nudiflora]|uniref:Uncharacterized protein n=1 Tax=Prunus yedoensis var. nudiflora TaxID=2094558 RepID=A0A314UA40_PRUYE|nr:uncharacterized protein Pyn_16043 [Prunus yedoensis var. nudiflora]